MIAERIAALREQRHLTQAELAALFGVSTDFLLGVEAAVTVSVVGLTEQDILAVTALIRRLREKNREGLQ